MGYSDGSFNRNNRKPLYDRKGRAMIDERWLVMRKGPCETCDGEGVISTISLDAFLKTGQEPNVEKTCPECKGTGETERTADLREALDALGARWNRR
jgi:hypothetical protein